MSFLVLSINQLFMGVILLSIGLFNFFSKKAESLIAGYNTKSAQEKSLKNETAIRKFIGMMLIVDGVIMLLFGLLILLTAVLFSQKILSLIMLILSWVLFFLIIILGLIYLNTSNRFNITK